MVPVAGSSSDGEGWSLAASNVVGGEDEADVIGSLSVSVVDVAVSALSASGPGEVAGASKGCPLPVVAPAADAA